MPQPTPEDSAVVLQEPPPPGVAAPDWVVGIGSSAGGLEALTRLLGHLPARLPAALVIIQHMSHTHRSLLVELLARETTMPVSEIRAGDMPMAGHVHIAPAKTHVELQGGLFQLIPAATPGVPVPSADRFFLSLADAWGPRAVAVVLSGTGGDGAQGLRVVKLAGGATYAQSPDSARYEGMPQAAVETGSVDATLPPEGIAAALVRLTASPHGELPPPPREPVPTRTRILALVRERTGVDLTQYKESTIDRRLQRRVDALKLADEEHYLAYCEGAPQELDRLLQESLISVTAFFRDRGAFERLESVITELTATRAGRDEIRVWVPGCATGEEVYSLVMLFLESMSVRPSPPQLKVFATDIDGEAMQVARRGVYTSQVLAAVSPERLERFFAPVHGGYEIKPELRAPVVFARHDLVRDPPFLRIDLLSCRNLLIYFKPSLQARVVPMLAYAAAPQGHVFLGKSESVAQFRDLFDVVDKQARLFRSRGVRQDGLGFPVLREAPPAGPARPQRLNLRESHEQALHRLYAPPSVLVTRDGQILDVSGEAAAYLTFPRDRLQFNLGAVFRGSEGIEAMSLLQRAARTRERVSGRTHPDGRDGAYRLVVDPLPDDENQFIIAFVAAPHPDPATGDQEGADHETLRNELAVTREHLQTVIEELETSNEEMQALNEELQSANEELQSTNEELETSNEELQSTNEELTTVNDELARRADQLALIGAELMAILRSLPFPVLLLDRELRVVRHNAAAERLFAITEETAVLPLARLTIPAALTNLAGEIAEVASGRDMIERRVSVDEHDYLMLITRCEGTDVTGGVLVELVDITRLTHAEAAMRAAESRAKALIDHSPLLVATTDLHGTVGYVNPRMAAFLADGPPAAGRAVWDLFGREGAQVLRKRAGDMMTTGNVVECEHPFNVGDRDGQLLSLLYPLRDAAGVPSGYCLMAMDTTELGAARDALERADAINRAILDALSSEIAVLDERGVIVSVNDAWLRFAERNGARDAGAWVGTNYLAACDVPQGCPPAVPQGIRAVLEGRLTVFEHEYPCDSPTEKRWFRLLAARMDHSEARVAVMHIDITVAKLAQIAAEERLDRERALGASRERDLLQAIDEIEMFSYTVSHDLRAPLRTVLSFSDLLREELGSAPSAEALDCLKRIGDAGRRMHLYIDEILKLSHLARGGLTTREVDMSAMAAEIVAEARAQRPERGVDCSVEAGLQACADPPLLRAVLENLIGNAFKYLDAGRRGEIVVGRQAVADGHAFFVRDNGIGFDMSFRDKLFMPFQRLHHEAGIAGHGIGLAAAKRIIVRHGGRIWAEARPGFGATFFFTLP